ncbi:MAG TPA: cyclase family protein, partial [Baekduia sp.]|nr:cyclase family protein [Baekduia sp.]
MTDMTQADAGMLDATLSIHPGMLHGGPKPKVETAYSLAAGDDFNVTRWTLSAHAGTHVEAPLHTVDGAASVAALPLSIFVGPARVLDLTDVDDEVTAADLVRAGLADDERVLLKTTNSTSVLQQAEKAERWVGLAPDAAELLVARGVKLVGVDYLTVESPAREATFDAHYVLNGAGVAIIESVDLSSATAGPIELACLPMKLDAEAAPARVLLAEPRDRPTGTVIDISARVADGTLTWGKRPERIEVESLSAGDMCNVTRWYLGTHSGTHVDAPLHYNDSQPPIDEVALDTFIGPARVLDL